MRSRLLVLLFLLISAVPAWAAGETEAKAVVQTFSDRLLSVMKQADALGYQGRVEKLRPAVADAYDMAAMANATLGVAAKKLTPEEFSAVTAAYGRYSVAIYADQFDGYDGESFEVDQGQPLDGGQIMVKSRIVTRKGQATQIDYLMHQDGAGKWKIVDVLFEGTASQVAVRRSQFVPIVRQGGAAALISMLDGKTESMGSK